MKIKFIFSTETEDFSQWIEFPFIPRLKEWISVTELFGQAKTAAIQQSALCWSGNRGIVQSVEYRKNNAGFYAEIYVWCED